jgi:O-antigen ligase
MLMMIGALALQLGLVLLLNGDLERFVRWGRLRRQWILLAAGAVAGTLLLLLVVLPLLDSISDLHLQRISFQRLTNVDSVIGPRAEIWEARVAAWDGNWLFGSGVGSVLQRSGRLDMTQVIDNYWLLVLLEQGVVGIVLHILLFGILMAASLRLMRRPATRNVGIAGFVSIVWVVILAFSATVLNIFPVNVLLWTGAGYLLWFDQQRRLPNRPSA